MTNSKAEKRDLGYPSGLFGWRSVPEGWEISRSGPDEFSVSRPSMSEHGYGLVRLMVVWPNTVIYPYHDHTDYWRDGAPDGEQELNETRLAHEEADALNDIRIWCLCQLQEHRQFMEHGYPTQYPLVNNAWSCSRTVTDGCYWQFDQTDGKFAHNLADGRRCNVEAGA